MRHRLGIGPTLEVGQLMLVVFAQDIALGDDARIMNFYKSVNDNLCEEISLHYSVTLP